VLILLTFQCAILKLLTEDNSGFKRKPTSRVSRVGHLRLDSSLSKLPNPTLSTHPHTALAAVATTAERDVKGHDHDNPNSFVACRQKPR